MDTKNNEYKRIVNKIAKNQTLERSIGSYIEENYEEESKIDYYKAKKTRTHRAILASIFISLLLASLIIIIIGSLYPLTPSGVVKQYLFEVENGNFEEAEKFTVSDYEIRHDFFKREGFNFKIVYNVKRSINNRKSCTVDVWIEYLDETAYEYMFMLRKTDGKWRIITRETGSSDTQISEGIHKYIPDKDEPQDVVVDFFYSFSNEELVEKADVIAKIKVEEISHVLITSMDKSIYEQKSMYGKFKVIDIYYSNNKKVKKNSRLEVSIFYEPAFANIVAPEIEENGEYIVFLEKLPNDFPKAWEFFDYSLISDFNKYKMDITDEKVSLIMELVNKLK